MHKKNNDNKVTETSSMKSTDSFQYRALFESEWKGSVLIMLKLLKMRSLSFIALHVVKSYFDLSGKKQC